MTLKQMLQVLFIVGIFLQSAELCKNQFTRAQLLQRLNRINCNTPLGNFNPSFVSFTFDEIKNFRSILFGINGTAPSVDSKLSTRLASSTPPSSPESIETGPCQSSDSSGFNRLCEACPVATFLGFDVIPPFINEVICRQNPRMNPESNACSSFGLCQNTVLTQQFLRRTGKCDDNDFEELEPFEQDIRVCCQCFIPGNF